MTLACATYGRQIFGVGGRLAWADDSKAGCYDMPTFIYDAQSEVVRSSFDVITPSENLVATELNNITARLVFLFSLLLNRQ